MDRITDPSLGWTRYALFGSTWSRIHSPAATKARSFGSLQGALKAFSTRLEIAGRLDLSSTANRRDAAARPAPAATKFRRETREGTRINILLRLSDHI